MYKIRLNWLLGKFRGYLVEYDIGIWIFGNPRMNKIESNWLIGGFLSSRYGFSTEVNPKWQSKIRNGRCNIQQYYTKLGQMEVLSTSDVESDIRFQKLTIQDCGTNQMNDL